MFVSLGFIAQRLITGEIDFSLFASPWVVAGVAVLAIAEGFGILGASLNFRSLVRNISGVSVEAPLAVNVYSMANLYKYIPGSVVYVLGRNRLAVENDKLSHGKVLLSTFIEGVLFVAAAAVIALVCVFDHSVSYLDRTGALSAVLPTLGLSVAVAGSLIYLFRSRVFLIIGRLRANTELLRLPVLAKRLGCAVGLVTLWGSTFLATVILLGHPASLDIAPTIIGLYLLSWLAGFLTPGAPSGIGIREAVMLMFLSDIVGEAVLLSAVVTHRAINIVGDVVAYGLALTYSKYSEHSSK